MKVRDCNINVACLHWLYHRRLAIRKSMRPFKISPKKSAALTNTIPPPLTAKHRVVKFRKMILSQYLDSFCKPQWTTLNRR